MSITSVIADNHKMSLSWIKFLCKKNIKIPNDNKKVNNWLILTNDSTLFKATSNESIAINTYPEYDINKGSLINFFRFRFLKKRGIDIIVKKLTMLTVRYWTTALSKTSPYLYVYIESVNKVRYVLTKFFGLKLMKHKYKKKPPNRRLNF